MPDSVHVAAIMPDCHILQAKARHACQRSGRVFSVRATGLAAAQCGLCKFPLPFEGVSDQLNSLRLGLGTQDDF